MLVYQFKVPTHQFVQVIYQPSMSTSAIWKQLRSVCYTKKSYRSLTLHKSGVVEEAKGQANFENVSTVLHSGV